MRPIAALALLIAVPATTAGAQESPQRPPEHVIVAVPGKLAWGPAPAILPAGAELAVMEGDPGKAGAFTMRLKMPDGYRIPPHSHPFVEHVTVIRGTFRVGMGDRFDASRLTNLQAGTFAALGPGVRHFAEAEGETVLQLHGQGPWTLTYVNPADDPRKTTP